MTPSLITAEFRSWLGVPWVHQGRTRHGIDCAGLIVCALGNLGLLPRGFVDPIAYGREPQPQLSKLVERWCIWTETPQEGTLVLMRWAPNQDPAHLGYCSGRNLIHAYSRQVGRTRGTRTVPAPYTQRGRVLEHRYGEPWVRQTVGIYLLPGVEYP